MCPALQNLRFASHKNILLSLIFCIAHCSRNDVSCFCLLDSLFSTDSLSQVELIVSVRDRNSICASQDSLRHKLFLNTNIKEMSLTRNASASAVVHSAISKNAPIFIVFIWFNDSEVMDAVSQIVDFQQNNRRGRLRDPTFLLVNPIMFHRKDIIGIEKNPNLSPFLDKLSLRSSVYILHSFNYLKEIASVSQGHECFVLIQEMYSIRDQSVKFEIEVSPEFNYFSHFMFTTRRRSDFRKATVVGIAMDETNYPFSAKFKPNSTELLSGFDVEVFHYFRDALNFSDQVIKAIGYIRPGPNETLTGYAIQLNNGDGDIAIPSGEFLTFRLKGPDGITYIHPVFHAPVTAFFKQPPPSSIRNVFTQVFTAEVWLCFVTIWLVIVSILRLSVRVRQGRIISNDTDDRIAKDSIIWAIGAICQQGWHMSPSSPSVKITFVCGIFTGLISYVAYSASLVSMLSIQVVPIREFIDLLRENFYVASDQRIPTAIDFVKDLEETNKIPKLGENVRFVDVSDSFQTLLKTRFALVTIPDSFYPVIRQNHTDQFICSAVSTKVVNSQLAKSSCLVKRGSPLREFFNYKLLVMQERGVKARMMQHYVMGTSIQCLETGTSQLSFELADIFTPFLILIIGILLSFLIALFERFPLFRRELTRFQRRKQSWGKIII